MATNKNKLIQFLMLTLVIFGFTSCHNHIEGTKGNGNVTTEERPAPTPFSNIEAGNGIEVYVEQADKHAISVEADDNIMPFIKTEIEGNTLKIYSEGSYSATRTIVTVRLPEINTLSSASACHISTINTIRGEQLILKSGSGSQINAKVEYDNIFLDAGSGSSVLISGKALQLSTEASSGSQVNAGGLLVNDVVAKASSGSSTEIHPIVNLTAEASSGSSINYYGSPKHISKSASSAASINQQN